MGFPVFSPLLQAAPGPDHPVASISLGMFLLCPSPGCLSWKARSDFCCARAGRSPGPEGPEELVIQNLLALRLPG